MMAVILVVIVQNGGCNIGGDWNDGGNIGGDWNDGGNIGGD